MICLGLSACMRFLNKNLQPFDIYNICTKLGQSVVPYALISQKRVTHSTIKVLHQPTSSECVTTFPCSLPSACPNDNKGKLQKFAMVSLSKAPQPSVTTTPPVFLIYFSHIRRARIKRTILRKLTGTHKSLEVDPFPHINFFEVLIEGIIESKIELQSYLFVFWMRSLPIHRFVTIPWTVTIPQ